MSAAPTRGDGEIGLRLVGPPGSRRLREPAVRVLSRAFRDNPINVAVVRGTSARRERSNAHGMRASLLAAELGGAQRWEACASGPGLAGALVAIPPDCLPLPRPPLGSQLRCLLGQGWRVVSRWGHVQDAIAMVAPREPHWILSLVGVDPGLQGRGIGGALVSRWLSVVDQAGEPAHLETDRESSVRFYRRFGFEIEQELRVLGVPVWTMRRPVVRSKTQ